MRNAESWWGFLFGNAHLEDGGRITLRLILWNVRMGS
jgi:hypothetical protein